MTPPSPKPTAAEIETKLAAARAAYAASDFDRALSIAQELVSGLPRLAAAHQIAALAERRRGRFEQASTYFNAALQAAPDDPHILNSYANMLGELGDIEGALQRYGQALTADPQFAEGWVNYGLACKRAGRRDAAREAFERATRLSPRLASGWHALGVLRGEDGDLDEAITALDEAVAINPSNLRALLSRAGIEADETVAATYYARAAKLAPDDPEIAVAHALARHRDGETSASVEALERLLAARPVPRIVPAALARIRWETGDENGISNAYGAALSAQPGDAALWGDYFAALMRAGRPETVLATLADARGALGAGGDVFEAAAATESGDTKRADQVFARLDLSADTAGRIPFLRHQLRTGRPDEAAVFAESMVKEADGAGAWPYLATAWRLLDDPKWRWLEGDPRFIQTFDLSVAADALDRLATVLGRRHRTRRAPLDQSLRGGSQTDGDLFLARDPELGALRKLLADAVADYVRQLPAHDPQHPLLGPQRSAFKFSGAWSVRLAAGGRHVNHVHPEGWISSAFYIALPESLGVDPGVAEGWLTFGEPPAELGLDLAPFRTIRPEPGRLALFPSTMWHGTRPFGSGERLTLAFDIQSASD